MQGAGKLAGFSGQDSLSQFLHLFTHFTNSEDICWVHSLGCPHQQREGCDSVNTLETSTEMMSSLVFSLEEENLRAASEEKDFPGGPVAKTPHFQCRRPGFTPWSGNQVSHAATKDPACHKREKIPHAATKTWLNQINK